VWIKLLGTRIARSRRKVSFYNGFEDSVRFDRSEKKRKKILKRRASMSKTTRGKTTVDTRLAEGIEGGRLKMTRWSTTHV